MVQSMTGFANSELQLPVGRLSWEIRSVNHRYLELAIRLPEEFRPLESDVRERLSSSLGRGKVDAGLRFHPARGAGGSELVLNTELARHLLDLRSELAALAGTETTADPDRLLGWPGLITEQAPDAEPLHRSAMELLDEALRDLQAARGREGEKLATVIEERLEGIERIVSDVRQWLPEIRESLRERLISRIGDLPQPLDPGRLEQEVVFQAQKIDVDEELDRLTAHISETRNVLKRAEPVGRRLDFLMQEFNRESNTLSSKSIDNRTTQAAVELKVLIEQMREQVQNIE